MPEIVHPEPDWQARNRETGGHRNPHAIALSQAVEGYFVYAQARRLGPNTLDNYAYVFRKLAACLPDDPPLTSITPATIRGFLNAKHLSKKMLLSLHADLSALWRWRSTRGW